MKYERAGSVFPREIDSSTCNTPSVASSWLFVSAYESSPSSVSLLRVEELLLLPGEGRRKDLFLPWEGGRYS
jgi:hypothetical protein